MNEDVMTTLLVQRARVSGQVAEAAARVVEVNALLNRCLNTLNSAEDLLAEIEDAIRSVSNE